MIRKNLQGTKIDHQGNVKRQKKKRKWDIMVVGIFHPHKINIKNF